MVTQSPQGLASLGRYGDSMLVHMNPSEVAGLQSLAMAQGGSLTINPQTGLPEAVSLGGFFKGLLPMFAGMATGGAGMPLWAGIAAGAATGAITSKDKLMGAITGGLGGYGGYNLGQGFAAAATPTTPTTATAGYVNPMTAVNASDVVKQGIANPLSGMNAGLQTQNLYPTNLLNQANAAGFAGSAATGATGIDKSFLGGLNNLGPGVQNVGSGMKNVFTGQPGAFDAFKASFVEPGAKPISDLAAYGKIAMPVGGAALSGLEPSDIYGEPINMASAKSKEAYDPYATLNLGGSSGLRLVAEGGYIDGYATGGTIQSGGIRDLYGTADDQTKTAPISANGFGLGRLNNLASEQALNQAQTLGYAMGGPISFADGGNTDIEPLGLPTLSSNVSNIKGDINNLLPSIIRAALPLKNMQGSAATTQDEITEEPSGSLITKVAANLKEDPNYKPANALEESIVNQLRDSNSTAKTQGLGSLVPNTPITTTYNPSVSMGPTYYAGMNAPKYGMAKGGYLDGAGDGMSDSIPATIEGKQPARLADGEFVVSADVVSHLGNGSTKAGAKKLYKMMDKVRLARTGTKKQGKQINPDKYLPR